MDFKKDFPMLSSKISYFDNAATTFKPRSVINSVSDYYENYCANAHRGDYDISRIVDDKLLEVRKKTAKFINAEKTEEIVFTSGATEGLNLVIKGFFKDYLKSGDEVLITKAEHASLVLPWFEVAGKNGAIINYIDLESDLSVTMENVKKAITKKLR